MKSSATIIKPVFLFVLFYWIFSASAQMNIQFADTLEQTLVRVAKEKNLKGVASAVIFPDGTKWSAAAGYHGNDTLRTDMLFDIGSNTKSMISATILLLEEEGLLSVNDHLYDYIDTVEYVPSNVVLKHLLQMRSGIARYTDHPDFISTLFADRDKLWHPDSLLTNFMAPRNFPAGYGYQYSNTNYLLLGKVIESVTGLPLHQVLRDRLYTPLALDSTYLDTYEPYSIDRTGYYWNTGQFYNDGFKSLMSATWAAGGVIATPTDFVSWCHQLARGDVLSEASMTKLLSGTRDPQTGDLYGMGIEERNYNGRKYLMHGGTTMQNSEMHYSLESDFSVVVMDLDQSLTEETYELQLALIDLLEYAVEQPPIVISSVAKNTTTTAINVYPNPSAERMTISLPYELNASNNKVEVYTMHGQLVAQNNFYGNELTLNKDELGNGMFIVRAYSNEKLLSSQKIVFY